MAYLRDYKSTPAWPVALLVVLLVGCTGVIGGGPPGPEEGGQEGEREPDPELERDPVFDPEQGFECDEAGRPGLSELKRLSVVQYRNVLTDLFGDGVAARTVDELDDELNGIPVDGTDEGAFPGLDNRVSNRHVGGWFDVADSASRAIANRDNRLAEVAGDCALTEPIDDGCFETFVEEFGLRAYRRPLTNDEIAFYVELNDGSRDRAELYRAALFTFFISPPFLYHFELEGAEIEGDADFIALDDYAIASRLSFLFWQSMPDDELFRAAAAGELTTDDGFEAQVNRMFDDPRTRRTVREFYHDWLGLRGFVGFANSPAFEAFADGDVSADRSSQHYEAMVEEIDALTDYYTWQTEGTWDDVLTSELVFATDADLANIYGTEVWDGTSPPAAMPQGERSGLLTRAAFLLTGDERNSPIHRGAFIRRRILCDPLPSPDPNALPEGSLDPPINDGTKTTRQLFEEKTSLRECSVCHNQINPLGFGMEAYDSIGRYRVDEQIYDETGALIGTLPIDTTVHPRIHIEDETTSVASPVELSETIAASSKTEACFAVHWFQFALRREGSAADGCALEAIRLQLSEEGGSIRAALRAIALRPEFRQRRIQ